MSFFTIHTSQKMIKKAIVKASFLFCCTFYHTLFNSPTRSMTLESLVKRSGEGGKSSSVKLLEEKLMKDSSPSKR